MIVFLYLIGGLGVVIVVDTFLLPYIRKVLFWLKVKKTAKRMAKSASGEGKQRLNDLAKATNSWIKKEKL